MVETKRFFWLCRTLGITLCTALLLAACNPLSNNSVDKDSIANGDASASSSLDAVQHESNAGSEKSYSEQLEMSQDIYLQAMEKWKTLGGSSDFKNIDGIDTEALVKIYSYYMIYSGNLDYDAIWMDTAGFDRFVKDYFDLSPEQFHQDYKGIHQINYDSEKGFRFYLRTSILPDDTKYEMINFGKNDDGTHYFEAKITFELPKELVPEGESAVERITKVTFRYADEMIYFLKASYEQNGKVL